MTSFQIDSAKRYAALLWAMIFVLGASAHAAPAEGDGSETQSTAVPRETRTFDTAVSPHIYAPPVQTSSIEPIQNRSEPQDVRGSFWIEVPGRPSALSSNSKMTISKTAKMRTYESKQWHFDAKTRMNPGISPANEKYVFFCELHHPSSNPIQNWRVRVGKGGQIYSLLGHAEAIPNSREYVGNQGQSLNRWIDRSIQGVVIPGECQRPEWKEKYSHVSMIHQAGSRPDDVLADHKLPYFNPILGYEYKEVDPLGGSSLNMVQLSFYNQKHVKLKSGEGEYGPIPLDYHPKVLMWTYIRDLGEGVFERVFIVYNFGESYLWSFCDMWTGLVSFEPAWRDPIRDIIDGESRMVPILTKPTGEWYTVDKGELRHFRDAGGWTALVSPAVPGTLPPDWTVNDNNYGLGYVFGTQESQAGDARIIVKPRFQRFDLTVVNSTMNRTGRMEPGEIWYSSHYFILDEFRGIRKKGERLKAHATYGEIEPYALDGSDRAAGTLSLNRYGSEVRYPKLRLWDRPIKNGAPIFTIYDRREEQFLLTDDPYILSDRPMDGRTLFVRLNGFARKVYKGDAIPENQVSLSSQIPASSYREGDRDDYSLYASIAVPE